MHDSKTMMLYAFIVNDKNLSTELKLADQKTKIKYHDRISYSPKWRKN